MTQTLTLNGAWQGRQTGKTPSIKKTFAARVPGCVHLDLLRAGLIPDPYWRDNERNVAWIGDADWEYARRFTAPPDMLKRGRVLLRCHGLDTLATVRLNGVEIGQTDNQFRTYEWDVKRLLRPGRDANTLEITFASANRHTRPLQEKRPLSDGRGYIRKSQCNFGWDWGPVLVTAGIWKNIELAAFDTARLADVRVAQEHGAGGVKLRVEVEVERVARRTPCHVHVILRPPAGHERDGVVEATAKVGADNRAVVELDVAKPRLWWPAGMGGQPLYEVEATLMDEGTALDSWTRRTGLRTLRLAMKDDAWGQSFHFEANGVPFYAKGTNWIPADTFPAGIPDALYDTLLRSAAEANMNMVRAWGGGIYEDDRFYDLCDELGLCVWQDFMFACGSYPSFDKAWMANVRREFEDNIRRVRHHACLAVWCGNNEMEEYALPRQGARKPGPQDVRKNTWKDYQALFDRLLPSVIKRLDAGRDYIPSSSYTPGPNRKKNPYDPDRGDAHLYAVWHGWQPYEWYRGSFHRFCSEFGTLSFPEPRCVEAFTEPGDRNFTSRIMDWHQRAANGNAKIMMYTLSGFRAPAGFDNALWLSQIQHGEALKTAVEHWRRNMPRCMGALYWQLNDCWPVVSCATIDWKGRWKAPHYAAKKFFARQLVSAVEDAEKRVAAVHVTSDDPRPMPARVEWTLTDTAGRALAQGGKDIRTPANGSAKVLDVEAGPFVEKSGLERLLLWLELRGADGEVLSSNLVHWVKPKHLELEPPGLKTTVRAAPGGAFEVVVAAARPALWAWLSLEGAEARWSDNFFHVRPGKPVRVICRPEQNMPRAEFLQRLRASSLHGTHAPHELA
ncbi:MAG: hypothetical protein FWF96_06505 [Kiritimatiellaeota bacterium]|nr:hypothetical protein [Kiritimatiellota bacterium]